MIVLNCKQALQSSAHRLLRISGTSPETQFSDCFYVQKPRSRPVILQMFLFGGYMSRLHILICKYWCHDVTLGWGLGLCTKVGKCPCGRFSSACWFMSASALWPLWTQMQCLLNLCRHQSVRFLLYDRCWKRWNSSTLFWAFSQFFDLSEEKNQVMVFILLNDYTDKKHINRSL